jgi:hypothetical protein
VSGGLRGMMLADAQRLLDTLDERVGGDLARAGRVELGREVELLRAGGPFRVRRGELSGALRRKGNLDDLLILDSDELLRAAGPAVSPTFWLARCGAAVPCGPG